MDVLVPLYKQIKIEDEKGYSNCKRKEEEVTKITPEQREKLERYPAVTDMLKSFKVVIQKVIQNPPHFWQNLNSCNTQKFS